MKITLNGCNRDISGARNLEEVLNTMEHVMDHITEQKKHGVIVQLNNKIIQRDQWKTHRVETGDIIELFTMTGGG